MNSTCKWLLLMYDMHESRLHLCYILGQLLLTMWAFRQGNVQAAAGGRRAVQLRGEGTSVAFGDNFPGERDVPVLPGGLR